MFKEPSFVTIICEDEDDIGTVTFTEEEDDKAYINSPQIYKCIKLKELRLEKSLTQKQLSQLTKIPLTRLRKLENLNAYANIGELICLSRFLNVRIDYMQNLIDVKRIPDDLPYSKYKQFIKKHTIKNK